MKWGRKKTSSSPLSSGKAALISSVFPVTWLSKLTHRNVKNTTSQSRKVEGSWNSEPTRILKKHGSWRNGKLNKGDEEGFWRLSFAEEGVDGRKSGRFNSGNEHEVLISSCKSSAAKVDGREESEKFSDTVMDLRKMREMNGYVEILPETDMGKHQKKAKCKSRSRDRKDGIILKKTDKEIGEEKFKELQRPTHEEQKVQTSVKIVHRSAVPTSRIHRHEASMRSGNSSLRTIEENFEYNSQSLEPTNRSTAEISSAEGQKLKGIKIKELMSKSEKHRNSIYISRDLESKKTKHGKVRVYSPRTPSKVEVCKIRALEDMKKAKKMKEKNFKELAALDSFAVVKSSFDPQKDFRDSMVEMITETGIKYPEELEELLACYLTLNSDEYHDLIINVFRQVWFDLNPSDFKPEGQDAVYFYD